MNSSTTATETFGFLRDHPSCSVDRYEVFSPEFHCIRSAVFACIQLLLNTGDEASTEFAVRIRGCLSDWLTAPVPFEQVAITLQNVLQEADGGRYGADVSLHLADAHAMANEIRTHENPIRARLCEILEQELKSRDCRIFCHRSSTQHYESLPVQNAVLKEDFFLHGLKDYRESGLFRTLIKVGPMRASGWGAIPDAVFTAPRQQTVMQVLWSGCGDEPGFPFSAIPGPVLHRPSGRQQVTWSIGPRSTVAVSASEEKPAVVVDELQHFFQDRSRDDLRKAVLVQISPEFGIAYPPHAMLVAFDSESARSAIREIVAGDELRVGMFVVRALLGDVDLGGVRAQHGHFSTQWKRRLNDELQKDSGALIGRLRSAGLHLVHLRSALEHWRRPPSTVIHAPQQIRHFQVLIETLGLKFDEPSPVRRRPEWWVYAWNEIRRSRGEAIQAGFQGHDIVNEQLIAVLTNLLPAIRTEASRSPEFAIPMPTTQALQGAVHFNRVLNVEDGFLVPESRLKLIDELGRFDQWRV
jgi:hypothetical protein